MTTSTPSETTQNPIKRHVSDRPTLELLAPETEMAAITLRVANMDLLIRYYRDSLGLTILEEHAGTAQRPSRVVLGRVGTPVVILEHSPALKHASERQSGLYHTAILFETREDLAAAVYSAASSAPDTFVGSSDHLVSNAFYFTDPEGNGVELYWDLPRSEWTYDGKIPRIGGLALDPNQFLRDNLNENAVSLADQRPAKVGHVHLSVGDVPTAREFYVDKMGFEVIGDLGSALFVSAGGYHHHMAMNVWQSRGSGPRQLTLGLGIVRITVPTQEDIEQLHGRLTRHGIATGTDGEALRFSDPWLNDIEVRAFTHL